MDRPARTISAQERYARLGTAASPAVVDAHERARNPWPTRKGGDGGVTVKRYRVAILWRGDHETRRAETPYNSRYRRVFEELIALGIDAQPVVYADDVADEVRKQLLTFDAVLVWVNPLDDGLTRRVLDAVLRDAAATGPWISAHPEVILKMGVKEVLHRTRHLGWGTDTHLHRSMTDFLTAFPSSLRLGEPRVLKRNRGNGECMQYGNGFRFGRRSCLSEAAPPNGATRASATGTMVSRSPAAKNGS